MTTKLTVASHFLVLIAGLYTTTTFVSGANILFYFPGVNFSQKNSVWPMVVGLAKNGHNVTFLSPQTRSPEPHKNILDLSSQLLQDMVSPLYKMDRFADREASREKLFDYSGATIMLCQKIVNERLTDPILSALFSTDTTFDLVIVNSLLSECGFFVAKYFNAKTIHYSPCTVIPFFHETFGVSTEAAWIPDFVYKFENIPMTFIDRAYNALLPLYWQWMRSFQISPALEEAVKPLLNMDQVPSLYELENNVSVVLLNSHVSADFARTLSPLFVDVGGMSGWKQEKTVPKQFLDFMTGPNGDENNDVVLITFGSTVLLNAVKKRHQAMFFQMIDSFPKVKFLMRWKGPLPSFLGSPPENLMISEWLPQTEILSHPNVKAFITHGGISSIHEATYYGVPMIVLPLFSDQDYNAYRIEAQQVGLRVEIRGMTGDTLVDTLQNILTDEKFKINMMAKSAIFKDRPQSPVETAIFWTEFALRHDDTFKTLRPGNKHLNWAQIRLLDVYILYFVVAGVILFAVKILIQIVLATLRREKSLNGNKIKKNN